MGKKHLIYKELARDVLLFSFFLSAEEVIQRLDTPSNLNQPTKLLSICSQI